MYPNVKAEFARNGFTQDKVIDELKNEGIEMTRSTLSLKMTGKYDFTFNEAIAIKKICKTDLPLEDLFRKNEEAI